MKRAFLPLAALACSKVAFGAFGLSVSGGTFKAEDGSSPISDSALFQLVNLGPNGLPDAVLAGDWVGGDDVLIDLPYGLETEFTTSGGFDLSESESFEPGFLLRQFDFDPVPGVIEEGDLIILRWWPALSVSDFVSESFPALGEIYGEARVDSPINGVSNYPWVIPPESEPLAILDPLVSPDYNDSIGNILANTPEFDGSATKVVLPIPEPSNSAVVAAAAVLLVSLRRKSNR